jgi:predicted dehydrogenase
MHTFGIAGFGRIGKLYNEVLQRVPDCRVVRIGDPDHRAALAGDVENLIIATPPSTHVAIATDALNHGKNVLVEKPPARSVDEAGQLFRLAQKAGRTLFFGFHARYNLSVQRAAIELRDHHVRSFHALYRENVRKYHTNAWVFREGVLRDSGINVLSILTAALPHAGQLAVARADLDHSEELDSDVRAKVHFGSPGPAGVLEMDWLYPGEECRRIDVETDSGRYRIDIMTDSLYRDGNPILTDNRTDRLDREYTRMVEDFIRHVQAGTCSYSTNELRLLEEVYPGQ